MTNRQVKLHQEIAGSNITLTWVLPSNEKADFFSKDTAQQDGFRQHDLSSCILLDGTTTCAKMASVTANRRDDIETWH